MTEKRFKVINISKNGMKGLFQLGNDNLSVYDVARLLNELLEENEQLKQRNNRQAKQLDRLYNLIEEKDWRTLSDIIDDFKRREEQLQKEWGTYGDVE